MDREPLSNPHRGQAAHHGQSALTYAKRYSWGAICGISSEEDEDGNAAQGNGNGGPPPPKRTREQISAEANRKRQDVRDVEKDVQQIDSLRALDRYAQEVLTPDFMASLGMKQWAVEEYMGKRRRELENEQTAEENPVFQSPTAYQSAKFKEAQEWLETGPERGRTEAARQDTGYVNLVETSDTAPSQYAAGLLLLKAGELPVCRGRGRAMRLKRAPLPSLNMAYLPGVGVIWKDPEPVHTGGRSVTCASASHSCATMR